MTIHRCLRLPTLLILLLLTFTSVSASYRIVNESQRLAPESLAYPDHFGFSTEVNEKILLAGAENHGLGGAVYSFERGSDGLWKETALLLPEDPVQNGLFGGSIALRGSTAFVGANNHPNGENLGAGAVYVFERAESGIWIQKAKIQPEDAGQFDNFGVSLAVEGQLLAVGSVHSADYGQNSLGAVYIFQEDENGGWQQSSKLMVEEPAVDDVFGWTLSLSGSTLFVGDPFKDINEMADAGIVYVFDRANNGNWIQHQTLTTDKPQSGSYFGLSLALHGDRAVIGAPLKRLVGTFTGAAYVFERDGNGEWKEKQTLLPTDPTNMRDFGWAVTLDEDDLLVGSPGSSTVYQFNQGADGAWSEATQFQPSIPGSNDYLGRSVTISEDQAFAGQFPMTSGFGSVHVFDLPTSHIQQYYSFIPVVIRREVTE